MSCTENLSLAEFDVVLFDSTAQWPNDGHSLTREIPKYLTVSVGLLLIENIA
jgi:hypothetical protein